MQYKCLSRDGPICLAARRYFSQDLKTLNEGKVSERKQPRICCLEEVPEINAGLDKLKNNRIALKFLIWNCLNYRLLEIAIKRLNRDPKFLSHLVENIQYNEPSGRFAQEQLAKKLDSLKDEHAIACVAIALNAQKFDHQVKAVRKLVERVNTLTDPFALQIVVESCEKDIPIETRLFALSKLTREFGTLLSLVQVVTNELIRSEVVKLLEPFIKDIDQPYALYNMVRYSDSKRVVKIAIEKLRNLSDGEHWMKDLPEQVSDPNFRAIIYRGLWQNLLHKSRLSKEPI